MRSADWSHWVSFSVSCLPQCALAKASTAASSLVGALLTRLSDLLLDSDPPLPPAQLEALLAALHHTHHFCLFGQPPQAKNASEQLQPPRSPSQAILYAQQVMHEHLPLVLLSLLYTWFTASPTDVYMRQLAQVRTTRLTREHLPCTTMTRTSQAPLALLSRYPAPRRELLGSMFFLWEQLPHARSLQDER